jgi:hypothetical protein
MASTVPTLVSLPNAKLAVLAKDGTLTLPWRLFFQNLYTRSGGSSGGDTPDLNQIIEELAAVTITANDALTAAEDAQTQADQGALLGQVASAEGDPTISPLNVLELLGLTSLDFVASSSAPPTPTPYAGMLPLVTGDLPGPVAIADPYGQFIGVPL